MSGERKLFRRRVFGGFDPKDVMEYIAELAKERNECLKVSETAESEISRLSSEVISLQNALRETERRLTEIKIAELGSAAQALRELETAYHSVRSDMDAAAGHISDELRSLGGTLDGILTEFTATGERISDLRTSVDASKAELFSE